MTPYYMIKPYYKTYFKVTEVLSSLRSFGQYATADIVRKSAVEVTTPDNLIQDCDLRDILSSDKMYSYGVWYAPAIHIEY